MKLSQPIVWNKYRFVSIAVSNWTLARHIVYLALWLHVRMYTSNWYELFRIMFFSSCRQPSGDFRIWKYHSEGNVGTRWLNPNPLPFGSIKTCAEAAWERENHLHSLSAWVGVNAHVENSWELPCLLKFGQLTRMFVWVTSLHFRKKAKLA